MTITCSYNNNRDKKKETKYISCDVKSLFHNCLRTSLAHRHSMHVVMKHRLYVYVRLCFHNSINIYHDYLLQQDLIICSPHIWIHACPQQLISYTVIIHWVYSICNIRLYVKYSTDYITHRLTAAEHCVNHRYYKEVAYKLCE